jgi:glyoxylase-like metal-dependent hydrolase (beta-lactamase superfamily II)
VTVRTQSPFRLPGLSVFERGWLSSNNILLHGAPDEGATLVDSGHLVHADLTLALVHQALQGQPLQRLINTHLHSDHCGGNAALQAAHPGLDVWVPAGNWAATHDWDEAHLSYRPTGQLMAPFAPSAPLGAGSPVNVNGRRWDALAAPGHDPDSLLLFDAQDGVLISADALWENGFGVVFPELDGADAFDDVGRVLDLIATLPVAWVIPGHGAPFNDVAGALARARSRLTSFQAHPTRHARHAAKVLLKFHLMELRRQSRSALHDWAAATPLMTSVWRQAGQAQAPTPADWADLLVAEMCATGALCADDQHVSDA